MRIAGAWLLRPRCAARRGSAARKCPCRMPAIWSKRHAAGRRVVAAVRAMLGQGGTGMAEFLMPSLGADMEAGTLVEWLRKAGRRRAARRHHGRRGDPQGRDRIEVVPDGTIEQLLTSSGEKCPVGRVDGLDSRRRTRPQGRSAAENAPHRPGSCAASPKVEHMRPRNSRSIRRRRQWTGPAAVSPGARRWQASRASTSYGSRHGPGGAIMHGGRARQAAAPARRQRLLMRRQRPDFDSRAMRTGHRGGDDPVEARDTALLSADHDRHDGRGMA